MIICAVCRARVPGTTPVYPKGGKLVCFACRGNTGKRPMADPKVDGSSHSAEFKRKKKIFERIQRG